MRDTFVRTLIEVAKADKSIELVTGDLGFGVLKPYWEQLPDQFTNAGIAEQNMTALAAGMALTGKTVFTYSIGNFPTLRCLEQIRNDCAYPRANVKVVCVGGGFAYGSLGMSHHATEDIAILRALPDVAVVCPGDLVEAEAITRAIAKYSGTVYLRLGRGGEKRIHQNPIEFEMGKAIAIRDNGQRNDVAVISSGAILDVSSELCDILLQKGFSVIQYSFPSVKPIDETRIKDIAKRASLIVTIEEHNIVGGFGSAICEVLVDNALCVKVKRFGLNDQYCHSVGNQNYLREKYGLSAMHMAKQIEEILK